MESINNRENVQNDNGAEWQSLTKMSYSEKKQRQNYSTERFKNAIAEQGMDSEPVTDLIKETIGDKLSSKIQNHSFFNMAIDSVCGDILFKDAWTGIMPDIKEKRTERKNGDLLDVDELEINLKGKGCSSCIAFIGVDNYLGFKTDYKGLHHETGRVHPRLTEEHITGYVQLQEDGKTLLVQKNIVNMGAPILERRRRELSYYSEDGPCERSIESSMDKYTTRIERDGSMTVEYHRRKGGPGTEEIHQVKKNLQPQYDESGQLEIIPEDRWKKLNAFNPTSIHSADEKLGTRPGLSTEESSELESSDYTADKRDLNNSKPPRLGTTESQPTASSPNNSKPPRLGTTESQPTTSSSRVPNTERPESSIGKTTTSKLTLTGEKPSELDDDEFSSSLNRFLDSMDFADMSGFYQDQDIAGRARKNFDELRVAGENLKKKIEEDEARITRESEEWLAKIKGSNEKSQDNTAGNIAPSSESNKSLKDKIVAGITKKGGILGRKK